MEECKLYVKLLAIRKDIGAISKDSSNPFFKSKYFDVNKLLEELQPHFDKHKVLCLQPIRNGHVFTELIDTESGMTTCSSLELPQLNDPQKMGSCITYYRRYTLQSLLGLQSEDDDANKASGNAPKQTPNNDLPWLNAYKKGTKELTPEMAVVLEKMKSKDITSLSEIRKDYKVSKNDAAIIEKWLKHINQ